MTWALVPQRRRARAARQGGLALAPAPAKPTTPAAAPPPAAPAPLPPPAGPTLKDWIAVLAMVVGMFLAIMDVQIVTSSLTQIQGGLSASADEISWVQTAYLIADVVMIPLTGTLSRLLSTRVLFVCGAIGFVVTSLLCSSATTLPQMIVYRAAQGFCGGSIYPIVMPVVYTKFRGPRLATIMVFISLILNLSSTLGPTIGGFLTDTFSWHWLFLVNIVPGIAVAIIVWFTLDLDRPDFSLLRNFDLLGLVLMAVFLGCAEYALEEGPRWDWLSDDTICGAVIIATIAGGLFFWRVLSFRQPIVDLSVFDNRNFTLGTFYTFIIGVGMYSTTYLVPLFLAQVRGYNAFQVGTTVVVAGITQMFLSPFSARLARRMDLRLMLTIGLLLFALAMYLNATLTNQTAFAELIVPQAVRGCALMCCYLPANLLALGTTPPDRLKNASALYNLTRDLGGAIGLATLGTVMNDRLHFHWNRLIESVNPARPVVTQFLDSATSRLGPMISGDPHLAALRLLAARVQREALVLTYNDALLLVGALFVAALALMPLMRKPASTALQR
jgi:MFS transporter, DHA2 family, multidrug resistance protein